MNRPGDVVVEAHQLTKHFGPVVAVERLDLAIARGEVFGFLGPNGAGKTTTTRLCLDLVRPTSGSGDRPRRERPGSSGAAANRVCPAISGSIPAARRPR